MEAGYSPFKLFSVRQGLILNSLASCQQPEKRGGSVLVIETVRVPARL